MNLTLLIHVGLALITLGTATAVVRAGMIRRVADRLLTLLGTSFLATLTSGALLVIMLPQTIGRACLSFGVFSGLSLVAYLTYRIRINSTS